MQHTLIFALSLFCMAAILLHQANAKCGECNLNSAACINKNTYNLCTNGLADTKSNFTCGDGEICIASRAFKCISEADAGTFLPACDNSPAACNKCDTSVTGFTCTSRTTFAQCSNLAKTGKCPPGMACEASTPGDVCISECTAKATGFECDSVEEIVLS